MQASPNAHVLSYLDQYLSRPAQHALQISGPWGCGKTHLIRRYFIKKSALYVSLNGAKTVEEITTRLYFSAYPVLEDKGARLLGGIARSVASAFRVNLKISPADIFDLDRFTIMVFDDLERCSLKPSELFGFMNNFVEHDSKHVILISNEDAFPCQRDYINSKEKVVGFTLRLKADIEAGLSDLLPNLSGDFRAFIARNARDIGLALKEGDVENIRAVRSAVLEFEPLFKRGKELGVSEPNLLRILMIFLILSVSYRTGKITRDDISARDTDHFSRVMRKGIKDYQETNLEKLDDLFTRVDLFSEELETEFLEKLVCDGYIDNVSLERKLSDLAGRDNPSANAEWRNLWHLVHQSDEVVLASLAKMLEKFDERAYTDQGEILHVFGLMYKLSADGILKRSEKRIRSEQLRYLNDKYRDRSLPTTPIEPLGDIRYGSAYGLGFMSRDNQNFLDVHHQLCKLAASLKDEELYTELLTAVSKDIFDVSTFRAIILHGERDDNVFSRPFMHKIDPRRFAEALLRQDAGLQAEILSALGMRYYKSSYREVEVREAPWLRTLITRLKQLSSKSHPITKFRIHELIAWNIATASQTDNAA